MAAVQDDQRRHVLPRWRTFGRTANARELDSLRPEPSAISLGAERLAVSVAEWRRERTVGFASDLVGAGRVLGRMDEVEEARQYLLTHAGELSPFVRELADLEAERGAPEAERGTPEKLMRRVHDVRSRLREAPKDPISWAELARLHLIFGEREKAALCMASALTTGGDARFVIRAAVRLWTHLGDPEQAHSIVRRERRTREDPWLLAAEVASSTMMGRRSRLLKVGKDLVGDEGLSPLSRSELAVALGTVALEDGATHWARRLFAMALKDPSENAVAQIVFEGRPGGRVVRGESWLGMTAGLGEAPEAAARRSYYDGKWREMLEECERWHSWEPFSTVPAILGSFVASVALDDDATGQRFAKMGLAANPGKFELLNNLAFAQIGLREYERAAATLRKCRVSAKGGGERAVLRATRGLLAMSRGDVEEGRRFYDEARVLAEALGKGGKDLADDVVIYRARAEGRLRAGADRGAIVEALEVVLQKQGPIAAVHRRKVEDSAERARFSV